MTPEERARRAVEKAEKEWGRLIEECGSLVEWNELLLGTLSAEIRAAVEEEREGCARIIRYTDMEGRGRCDECGALWDSEHDDSCIVPAIRARSET